MRFDLEMLGMYGPGQQCLASCHQTQNFRAGYHFGLKAHVAWAVKSGLWFCIFRVHLERLGALNAPLPYLSGSRTRLVLAPAPAMGPGHGVIGFSCFFLLNQLRCFEVAPPTGPACRDHIPLPTWQGWCPWPLIPPGSGGWSALISYCP